MTEEQQIVDLVQRATQDEGLRQELERTPEQVSQRLGHSHTSTVSAVVRRLTPQLTVGNNDPTTAHNNWWSY